MLCHVGRKLLSSFDGEKFSEIKKSVGLGTYVGSSAYGFFNVAGSTSITSGAR